MILLDKLAYSSPIRQKSPALKTLFAAGSLIICVSFLKQSGLSAHSLLYGSLYTALC